MLQVIQRVTENPEKKISVLLLVTSAFSSAPSSFECSSLRQQMQSKIVVQSAWEQGSSERQQE